jgi:N-carbamoyl-L-amino-acid hydrolase
VVAFADEEGARFGVACVGSQLSTGALTADRALALRDNDGTTLADALRDAGRRPELLGVDDTLTERVGVYVELHVEQGRALQDLGRPVAVASSIWPHGRWHLTFGGEANHAGTTRLVDRRDPMLPFASAVHAARIEAARHGAVATFGKVRVSPNGANAIPSRVDAWLDARAADEATLATVVESIRHSAAHYAKDGHVTVDFEAESITPIVEFPDAPRLRVQAALSRFGEVPVLPTAAGHDAGILSAKVPTAMLFVRNPTGVSHSPEEYAEIADCRTGAEALADVMADWVSR